MKKHTSLIIILSVILFSHGCENNNIFSWARKSGTDTSTEALLADAERALKDQDYNEAAEYYEKILKNEPRNSEALYGRASAEMKKADLDFRHIISVLVESMDSNEDPDDLIDELFMGLNISTLVDATSEAEKSLKKIAQGKADGTIASDNVDVNLSLGILITLNAAVTLLDKYEVNSFEDLDKLEDGVSESDISDTQQRVSEAKNYLEVAFEPDHEIIETFDDLIESMEDLKN
ncbi:MAG: hypothetical protein ACQESB_01735 [Elusimicrobiota bacterium]